MMKKKNLFLILSFMWLSTLFAFKWKVVNEKIILIPDKIDPQPSKYAPAGRGTNEMVIYTPESGKTTKTNIWGIEAIVKNGLIVKIGGNNSFIPKNGFVISGHGNSRIWIVSYLKEGMQVDFYPKERKLIIYFSQKSEVYLLRKLWKKLVLDSVNPSYVSNKKISKMLLKLDKKIEKLEKKIEKNENVSEKEIKKIKKCLVNIYWQQYPIMNNLKGISISADFFNNNYKYIIKLLRKYKLKFLTISVLKNGKVNIKYKNSIYTESLDISDRLKTITPILKKYGIKLGFMIDCLSVSKEVLKSKEKISLLALDESNNFIKVKNDYLLSILNRKVENEIIKIINILDRDYNADYILFANFFMLGNSGYNEDVRKQYFEEKGFDPILIKKSDFFDNEKNTWQEWKEKKLNDFYEKLKENKKILFILPKYYNCKEDVKFIIPEIENRQIIWDVRNHLDIYKYFQDFNKGRGCIFNFSNDDKNIKTADLLISFYKNNKKFISICGNFEKIKRENKIEELFRTLLKTKIKKWWRVW